MTMPTIEKLTGFIKKLSSHRYGLTLLAFLGAAFLTGLSCILFMWTFEFVLINQLEFKRIGHWCWITTPLLFLFSAEIVRRVAPCAAGTGIPQAIFAVKHIKAGAEQKLYPLLSPLTLVVKIAGILIAVWAGASTGREGPTVHVAVCVFFGLLLFFRKLTGINFDPRSAVVAGGAAGLAAAFNAPLAGVTFAIEELTVDYFAGIKDFVLMAIIIAAFSAKAFTGEYTYFGKLSAPPDVHIMAILVIGIVGGAVGALFSTSILQGQTLVARYKKNSLLYFIPMGLSLGLLILGLVFGMGIFGPGNQVAQNLVSGHFETLSFTFPFAKMAATLLTYWSGVAGGIFAPCLSIGSALGADIGYLLNAPVTACALIGMAAFLSGTIQAPITTFVIIFEMTGHHQMLLPIMLASMLGFMTARLLRAEHLYQALSANFKYLLDTPETK